LTVAGLPHTLVQGSRESKTIRKQEFLDRAAEWRLRPDVVEKNHALR